MKKNSTTRGTYYFADGYSAWYYGLSSTEKRNLIREHGIIVAFVPN